MTAPSHESLWGPAILGEDAAGEALNNRKAARALSLTIPPSVLVRADEVIE